MKQLGLLLFMILSTSVAFSQNDSCAGFKDGKFHDLADKDQSSYYIVDGGWFYEYSDHGKFYIKSKIDWEDNCTYSLTLTETNIPNFELKMGTQLRAQITKVKGDKYYYQYLPKGILEPGVLVKMDE